MSHFVTLVIVPSNRRVPQEVARLLAPYDESRPGPERRVYPDEADIKQMAEHYKIEADPALLAPKMKEWDGHRGFVDSSGRLYYTTTRNDEAKWDWYVIGGRWTGFLDGYDPTTDPDNWEQCSVCGGTGRRDDALGRDQRAKDPDYTCNGCSGKGKSVKFSVKPYAGDTAPVAALTALKEPPFAIVTPDGAWHQKGRMGWWAVVHDEKEDELWKDEVTTIVKKYTGGDYVVVVVDCHI